MVYLKKNWLKLLVSAICLVGVILTFLLMCKGTVKTVLDPTYANDVALSAYFLLLAQFIFFLGIFVYCLLGTFENKKKIKNFVLLGAAIVALIFVVLCFAYGWAYMKNAQNSINQGYNAIKGLPAALTADTKQALDIAQFNLTSAIYTKIISGIIFSILPLLYTIRNFCIKED